MMYKKVKGFTLIEIMVAGVIGIFLMGVVISVFINNKKAYFDNTQFIEMQDNINFAMAIISNDLTNLGFYGSITYKDELTNKLSVASDCSNRASAISTKSPLVGGINGNLACLTNPNLLSDWIAIKNVVPIPVADASMDASTIYLRTGRTTGYLDSGSSIASAASSVLPGGSANMNFKYKSRIYYVDTDNQLIQKSLVNGAWQNQVLIGTTGSTTAGIENIQFLYGVDDDTPPDGVADFFVSASGVSATDWNDIVAIKIFILARSGLDRDHTDHKTYTMSDFTLADPSDNYHRKIFSSTVFLRNNWYILTGGI